jgi:hypothetical protein
LQDGFVFGFNISECCRHEQWSSQDCPDGHLHFALVIAQAIVPDNQLKGEDILL